LNSNGTSACPSDTCCTGQCIQFDAYCHVSCLLIDMYAGMIYDHRKIALSYLKGSFALDLISSIPFDLFTFAFGSKASALRAVRPLSDVFMLFSQCQHMHAHPGKTACTQQRACCETQQCKTEAPAPLQMRVVRLIRLAKLLRIFRVSKFMAAVESSVSVNYSQLHLVQHICVVLLAAHCMSCLCLLFSRLEVCTHDWW
jgi:hypothetical protein